VSIQNVLIWPACNIINTSAPLVCRIVNNALLHFNPTINRTLPEIVHILHFCLVASLLHYAPDFIFNWIEVGVVGDQKSVEMNAGVSRARALGHSLLKDEKLARDLTYGSCRNCCDSNTS